MFRRHRDLNPPDTVPHPRRLWLGLGGLIGLTTVLGMASRPTADPAPTAILEAGPPAHHMAIAPTIEGAPTATPLALTMGQLMTAPVDPQRLGFDPDKVLTTFDSGRVIPRADGRIERNYTITARDQRIELAPGVFYDAWTYNGRIPGPTLRATEGDVVQVTFHNAGSQPHSIHFHGIHPADQDGLEAVEPGQTRVYEFPAGPSGIHVYHCHIEPLDEHIDRGLYGFFIVDPRTPRPAAHELAMMMNAFDIDGDGENDIYAVNSAPFAYYFHPIPLIVGERVRIYLGNMTDLDPLNSFHLHANLFWLFRTGTRAQPDEYTDTVELGQGERHILEFTYPTPGEYMFHAHQAEFSAKGWMGCLSVRPVSTTAAPTGVCHAAPMAGMDAH